MPSSAKLVAKTVPVDLPTDGDNFVAYVARVSNPENQMNFETGPKLLSYLERKHHWSPFDMANAVIEVKTTRDIGRQMLRHWSARFQEFSQRYAEVVDFHEPKEARRQDDENRQNSIDDLPSGVKQVWIEQQQIVLKTALTAYGYAIDSKIAKECARVVLPEGLTMTTMYMNMSLRSWIHYMNERRSAATQLEHRIVANLCFDELVKHYPQVFERLR